MSEANEELEVIRHDAAHVLAAAVVELWPGTKLAIGPPIRDGFYYDFEFPGGVKVSEADFEAIEAKMAEHVAAGEPFERRELPVAEAIEKFRAEGQDYKVELIEDLVRDQGVESVSLYRNGPFEDLCRGPHAPSTGRIGAFKLGSVAGAYWRGDERRTMLTRIYGTAFLSEADLAAHLERIEQAKARDHRRLGRELGLFLLRDEAPGMPFWLPNGAVLLNQVQGAIREQLDKRGYVEVRTPQVMDEQLWHRSGHFDNYKENMFFTSAPSRRAEEAEAAAERGGGGDGGKGGDAGPPAAEPERRFVLKPMNCPGACLIYESERRSYRDLPLRLAEFGLCSRREREGVLHGLLRVRAFVQDDAHVYCTEEQIVDEVADCCQAIDELYATFGFEEVRVELSTMPEQGVGSPEQRALAEAALREALERQGREYKVNPGEGAFYGPKIDFHITDALERSWQCGTVQLDFFMPERFDLTYTGADNAEHRPVMIHRALLGSMERFVGVLIEHYGGELPLWLAPVQAVLVPVADRHAAYAARVEAELRAAGVRCRVDGRSESVGRKIREAELRKVPYMLVAGDREESEGLVAVRSHRGGDQGALALAALVERLAGEIAAR